MFAKWKSLWEKDTGNKKLKPVHYFIVLLGIGIAVMILTDFLDVERDQPLSFAVDSENQPDGPSAGESTQALGSSVSNDLIAEYENHYESQLREILSAVVGVGAVEVMVNLDSTPELVVEKNRDSRSSTTQESDKDRAIRSNSDQSRNEQVVVVQGGKQDQPVVVKTLKPKVRGVLVVAKGAENIQVKAWITEAVQKVLDVPAYKISILPKKG
jgi:stage III sporulation protein AG